MYKFPKILLLLLFLVFTSSLALAQDDNPYADIPMSRADDGAFVLGNPDASVTFIEFSDFLCPHCQDYEETVNTFIDQYVATGLAQFEFRMVPIIDPTLSPYAAGLVECANTLSDGMFWQARDAMFDITSSTRFSKDALSTFAESLGLDETALDDCTQTAAQITNDTEFAQEMRITGTPTVAVRYGDNAPVKVALPGLEDFPTLINATRPEPAEPMTIENGRYAGIQTYRIDDGGIVMGDPDAPITLVLFEDFMCPHCQEYQPTVHSFVEQYVATGQAKLEYRFFPIVNPDYSMKTAQVAECIALQDLGKFWNAHDLLYEFAASGEINDEFPSVISQLAEVDADAVSTCVDTSIQPLIDLQLGSGVNVTGTPGIRVRSEDGRLNMLYSGQQPLQSGALPMEALTALMENTGEISIGQPDPTLLNDNFLEDDSLITGEPCGAPCWQNITPGETTFEDARTTVEQLTEKIQDGNGGFAFSIDSNLICCQIASQDSSTVNTILLQLAPTNTVGQLIEARGEPSFVSGEPYTDNEYILTLFYPDLHALIYTVVDGENGQLSEDSPIFTVIYTNSEIMDTIVGSAPLDNWKGYLTYSEYMDGEFDYNGSD